ncbi:MAG: HAD-IA family hydrolase [Treponema sp.]|jgi:putative hydrolase of the HAD superfamily|nr:HAD-IA family hydrolase [Treponema sp.]
MIKHILFDLDNTLYSRRCGLENNVSARIHDYLAAWMGVTVEEAMEEREKRIGPYGTTLEWLIAEKKFTCIDQYYQAIYPENEADALHEDPGLRNFLKTLPCPLSILTNAPKEHADRVLKKLGIKDLFTEIFDLRRLGFKGKPLEEAFRTALETLRAQPEEVLFIDDMPKYVSGYRAIGGRGVLLDELDEHPTYPYEKIRDLREISGLFHPQSNQ